MLASLIGVNGIDNYNQLIVFVDVILSTESDDDEVQLRAEGFESRAIEAKPIAEEAELRAE